MNSVDAHLFLLLGFLFFCFLVGQKSCHGFTVVTQLKYRVHEPGWSLQIASMALSERQVIPWAPRRLQWLTRVRRKSLGIVHLIPLHCTSVIDVLFYQMPPSRFSWMLR